MRADENPSQLTLTFVLKVFICVAIDSELAFTDLYATFRPLLLCLHVSIVFFICRIFSNEKEEVVINLEMCSSWNFPGLSEPEL